MIKINRDFNQLAEEHKKNLKSAYTIEKNITDKVASESGKLKYFYKFLQVKLDLILTANTSQIRDIITRANVILGESFFTEREKDFNNRDVLKNRVKINELKSIFNYDLFIVYKKEKYCAYHLTEKLKINVCPYCNRQYTTTLRPTDYKGGTRPTLDHFYLKSEYPYLALSFYNLVPSCYSCNSQFRTTRKIGLHPYEQGFEKLLHFYTNNINSVDDFLGNTRQNVTIKLSKYKKQITNKSDIKNALLNSKVFRLEDLYNKNHQDDVRELIKRAIMYNDSCSKGYFKEFEKYKLFDSEKDARRTMLGNYTDINDLEKRPLAKLTKDICEELGI